MSSEHTKTNDPSAVVSSTLGAEFPQVTLPDGSKVQTGTFAALLSNIRSYDTLIQSSHNIPATRPGDRQAHKAKIAQLEGAFQTAIPVLARLGLFELFEPEEWAVASTSGLKGEGEKMEMEGEGQGAKKKQSPGRRKVGELAAKWMEEQKKEKRGEA